MLAVQAIRRRARRRTVERVENPLAQHAPFLGRANDVHQFRIGCATYHHTDGASDGKHRDKRIEREHPRARLRTAHIQAQAHTDDQQAREHNRAVDDHQAVGKRHARVFIENHRHNVAAAARSLLTNHQTCSGSQQHTADQTAHDQIVRQVQMSAEQEFRIKCPHRLARRIAQCSEQIDKKRKRYGRHDRTHAQSATEHQHRDEHQRNLNHQAERTDGHRRENGVNHDTCAESPTGHNAIRVDEVHQGHRRDEAPEKNERNRAERSRLRGFAQQITERKIHRYRSLC